MSLSPLIDTIKTVLAEEKQRIASVPEVPDTNAKIEKRTFEDEHQNLLLEDLKNQLEDQRNNIQARKKYAKRLFIMLCLWLVIILFITFMDGIQCVPFSNLHFNLSDEVIITLITTTTANIAVFFLVVTRYLFPTGNKK